MPALSTRNCTWPALALRTAWATSGVTVPTFGFGIRPRGPRIWPSVPTTRIVSGEAITTSKFMLPALTCSARSSMPTMSAPAARGFFGLGALREHGDALGLAGAVGHHDGAANDLVGLLRVDAELHGDVDRLVELGGRAFLDERERVVERVQLGAVDLACERLLALGQLGHDQTPSTVMPIERAVPAMVRTAASRSAPVRSLHLDLGDLLELGARELADLVGVRLCRALLELDRPS